MAENEYRRMRNKKNLSRDEVCNIAVDNKRGPLDITRLSRIETGKFPIHRDEVLLLADIYNEPTLCNYYCSNECEIGKLYVPKVEAQGLEKSILEIIASLNKVQKQQERLIEITADGTIDEGETSDFKQIRDELERISIAVEALQLWTEKNLGLITE